MKEREKTVSIKTKLLGTIIPVVTVVVFLFPIRCRKG